MGFPYFLRLAYLGTDFYGWQIQSTLRSVQGELWSALRAIDPEAPMPQGTGRTDAGVHARAQGVLICTRRQWDPYRLLAALNAHLAPDARVMAVQPAPEGFFPRHHAVAKRYIYAIQQGPAEDPFTHGRRWHIHGAEPLDVEGMRRASACLAGAHDFSSFRHRDCAARTPLRIIHGVRLEQAGSGLDLVFEGNRFLMHQVRIMAGTLVDVGKGRIPPEAMPGILAARDRRAAGTTAPPHGLYLDEVWYQQAWGIGQPSPWAEEPFPEEPAGEATSD
jgi:tRNA pseudouridine38-40 synthase